MARLSLLVLLFLIQMLNVSNLPECTTTNGIIFINEPQNRTICVGGQVRMDCTYNGTNGIPKWCINERCSRLEPPYKYNLFALILNDATESENNTVYMCYFERFENNRICMVQSAPGRLTVLNNHECEQRPENITRTAGETDVFIPCNVPGYIPPIWEINGLVYDFFQLPKLYTPKYGGILIKSISRSHTGTSFRCHVFTGVGYTVEASSIGYLNVTPRGNQLSPDIPNNDLYIDHQNTLFDEGVTLSWKPVKIMTCMDYTIVPRIKCGQQSCPVERGVYNTTQLSRNFSSDALIIDGKEVDFLIKATNNDGTVCNRTRATIQIQNSVTTMKLYSSFSQTNTFKFSTITNSIFSLVLPILGTEEDCFCPVLLHNNTKCYNLRSCSCLNNTVFSNSVIEFCHPPVGMNISIWIQNITREMNGSRLSMFHELFCEYSEEYLPPYRVYTNSLEITIVLPEPPKLDPISDNLCILPHEEKENPPDSYTLFVYDITYEKILQDTIMATINSSACFPISLYNITYEYSSKCAPIAVSVVAVNQFGTSESTTSIDTRNETGDACQCLNKTVNILVTNITEEEDYGEVYVSCNQSKYVSGFRLKVAINPEIEGGQDIIMCTRMNTITRLRFDGLSCNQTYGMTIYWSSCDQVLNNCCEFAHVELNPHCESKEYNVNNNLIIIVVFVVIIISMACLYLCTTPISCIVPVLITHLCIVMIEHYHNRSSKKVPRTMIK